MSLAAEIALSAPPAVPEEQARADLYALLARLWYAAPDEALLAKLAAARDGFAQAPAGALVHAWRALCDAAAHTDAARARAEYDSVFVGVGKAEVTLFASHYLEAIFKERIIVQLREELASLGLTRAASAHEPEDHLAALCDVMRFLVAAASDDAALQRQYRFFTRYIRPAYGPLMQAVAANGSIVFYQHVASFTQAFFDVELESFEML